MKKILVGVLIITSILLMYFIYPIGSSSTVYDAGQIIYTNQCWDSWNDHNNPEGSYYNGTLYISFGNGTGYTPWITTFDIDTQTWGNTVQIATSPSGDSHYTPAIGITDDGYIYCWYGAHVSSEYLKRSTNPEDVSSWTARATYSTSFSYPNIAYGDDGNFHIFYRYGGGSSTGLNYVRYSPSGNSYSSDTGIIFSNDWWYPSSIYIDNNDVIHLGFNQRDSSSSGSYRNSYYIYTDDYGATFYNADGVDLDSIGDGLPLSRSEADTYLMIEEFAVPIPYGARWCTRVSADDSSHPSVCYLRNDNDPVNEEEDGVWVRYATWNDTSSDWDIYNITTIPLIGYYGFGCGWEDACYPRCKVKQHITRPMIQDEGRDQNTIIVFLSECDFYSGNNVSNINVYKSTNAGKTWALEDYVTEDTSTSLNKWSLNYFNNLDNYAYWLVAPDSSSPISVDLQLGYYYSGSPGENIYFESINDQGNNSIVGTGQRYFNWTKSDSATKYQLQIANDSDFTDIFLDLDNISLGCDLASMPGGSYEELGDYVEFYLPYAYNITYYSYHYYRVRAYTTD